MRGAETGVTRVYSVGEMSKFMGITPPEPSDDKVKLSYDADNHTLTLTAPDDKMTSVVVIKAAYNGDITENVEIYHPEAFSNKTTVINDIVINTNEKVFVWNSIDGMIPLADVFSQVGE